MKIEDNENRGKLGEGRSRGMGFAYLKKTGEDTFRTVQPISACKDFLNEILYAEKTGTLCPSIHGLKYEKVLDIFDNNYAYMAIKICNRNGSEYYDDSDIIDMSNFEKNYKNLQDFINQIEEALKVEQKTEIIEANNDMFIVKMPMFWNQALYMMSLYTALLRAYQHYDKSLPALEFIDKKNCFPQDENIMLVAKKKLLYLIENGIVEQKFETFEGDVGRTHHSSGICAVKFPDLK